MQYELERSIEEVWQGHWSTYQSRPFIHSAVVLGSEADEAMQRSACRHQTRQYFGESWIFR